MGKSKKLLDSTSINPESTSLDHSQVVNSTLDFEDSLYSFDPTQTANIKDAKIHKVTNTQKAQQVRKLKDQQLCPYTDRCKCCLLPFVRYI